ncbi:hypothetical protein BKA80DRAFT_10169 [Phyllosticta citrichinensis]
MHSPGPDLRLPAAGRNLPWSPLQPELPPPPRLRDDAQPQTPVAGTPQSPAGSPASLPHQASRLGLPRSRVGQSFGLGEELVCWLRGALAGWLPSASDPATMTSPEPTAGMHRSGAALTEPEGGWEEGRRSRRPHPTTATTTPSSSGPLLACLLVSPPLAAFGQAYNIPPRLLLAQPFPISHQTCSNCFSDCSTSFFFCLHIHILYKSLSQTVIPRDG